MYAPDVWETTESERAYAELRERANMMGFATVHEALDRLSELMDGGQLR